MSGARSWATQRSRCHLARGHGGIGFRPQTPVSCHVGDRYYVIFVLPDTDHSLICEDIVIRRMTPRRSGRRSSSAWLASRPRLVHLCHVRAGRPRPGTGAPPIGADSGTTTIIAILGGEERQWSV